MPSEVRRGFTRISSNYTRLVTNVILGLALVPILLEALGNDGWAVIALLGSTIGLASMVEEITRGSLIREMGHAYHRGRPGEFRSIYNACIAVTAAFALIAGVLFALLWAVVPHFKITPELVAAARWLVVARGLETMITLQLAAPFNMYKVTERMVAWNAWQIVARVGNFAAALWVLLAIDTPDAGTRLIVFAVSSSALFVVINLLSVVVIAWKLGGLIPAPRSITRDALRTLLRVGGLNAAASVGTNLHRKLAPLLMNLAFGLPGNLILGFALQVTLSVRRLTAGMTGGLDAVTARVSTLGSDEAVRSIWHNSTRLHGVAAFGMAVVVVILAEPLLFLWLGKRIDDPATTIPAAAVLIRILTIGVISRAISDSWIKVLYGAGHVGCYAWLIFTGAFLHPLLFGLLLLVLPEPVRYTAVAWAFSAVFLGIHAIALPWRGAPALRVSYSDFYKPLLRPLAVALGCSPILLAAKVPLEQWTLLRLAVAGSAYGMVYAAGTVLFVMHGHERLRFTKAALRRLPGRG